MTPSKYIFLDGKFVKWKDAKIHVLTHGLHYGGTVYEGIRFYPSENGKKVLIFRLEDHVKRFLSSMKAIEMKSPFTEKELIEIIKKLIKKNKLKDGYIRPIAFYGYERLGIFWKDLPVSMSIAAIKWGAYLPKSMKMKISKWRRLSKEAVKIEAKVGGYYVNSNFATQSVTKEADEALLLDKNGFIAEAACANIFFVKNNVLYTPKRGAILPGLTRDTVIKLAKMEGIKVIEKNIKPFELKTFKEAFTTGTATEITPVIKINNKKIGDGKIGSITKLLQKSYSDLTRGKNEKANKKYKNWVTEI